MITIENIIKINKGVTGEEHSVLNENLIGSSLSSWHYYKNPLQQVASIVRGIAKNHAFKDGNKRTAAVVLLLISEMMGLPVVADSKIEEVLVDIASKHYSVEQVADLLFKIEVTSKYPRPKKTVHKGDSVIIYEAGVRDLEKPFGKEGFDKLVEETEGPQEPKSKTAKGQRNHQINPDQGLRRGFGEGFPTEKGLDEAFGLGYSERMKRITRKEYGFPIEKNFLQKMLS